MPDPKNPRTRAPATAELSRALLEMHPTAQVTVTDVEPTSVAAIAAGDLGSHPRATVLRDGRHRHRRARWLLRPRRCSRGPSTTCRRGSAARVFAEGTRVADKLLIIDLRAAAVAGARRRRLVSMLPLAMLFPVAARRSHQLAACLQPARRCGALARYADPAITLELRRTKVFFVRGRWQIAVASR